MPFRAINPLCQVPALELDDGTILTESVAICRYFEEIHPEPPLMGRDTVDKAIVEMWNRRMEFDGCPSTISHLARFITRRYAIGHFNEVTSGLVTPRSATRPLSLASEKRECQLQWGTRFFVVDIELQQCPWL